MTIIKCKMCGGDLNIIEGASTAECEYCGSVQTIPKVDDEKKLTLFARANRLRAVCEFDKAAGIYEAIVADFPEEAEAYWGLVLCKYGIEYVDDPATGKKIPTCHRSSFDSIMDDSDLEQVLENADVMARRVYRDEAKQIEEIRKGIIAVSANEEPYDIFICYKETSETGDRTLDSVLAQDVHDALTEKGYRVFFSRISLEEKLGVEYEPYIFAALNSAKIMLVFGTDYEHFNAVWVKNEWSRFLKLMAKNKDKHLIPCYKGIDAYDMPKEFAKLQAQDLGKVGAIQDLLRGIEKLLPTQASTKIIQERVVVGGSQIASLLDRGNMALEDGDWDKADSFFEDVLNNDSKNAQAYIGKTLAMEKCSSMEALVQKRKEITMNARGETLCLEPDERHLAKVLQSCSLRGFVEPEQIRELYSFDLSYRSEVTDRKQQYQNEEVFWAEHKQLSRAEKFATGIVARKLAAEKKALFTALANRIRDAQTAEAEAKESVHMAYAAHIAAADQKAAQCYEEGLHSRQSYYQGLLHTVETSTKVTELRSAAKSFEELGDYQDSEMLAKQCWERAAQEQAKIDAENERLRELEKVRRAVIEKQNRRNKIIALGVITIFAVFCIILSSCIIPQTKYNAALELLEVGDYKNAKDVLREVHSAYRNNLSILDTELIGTALSLMESGEYYAAHILLIPEFGEEKYAQALQLLETKQYAAALVEFLALNGYQDSHQKAEACRLGILDQQYDAALALMQKGEYSEAMAAFQALAGHKDSAQKIEECEAAMIDERYEAQYQAAVSLMEAKRYTEAITAFEALDGYRDSVKKIEDCQNAIYEGKYQAAVALMDKKQYAEAIAAFEALNGYKDSTNKIAACQNAIRQQNESKLAEQYQNAKKLMEQGKIAQAAIAFGKLGNYSDAKAIARTLWAQLLPPQTIAGSSNTLAVKNDGTVVAVGKDNGQCNVGSWRNIVSISTSDYHTLGVKEDGTVIAAYAPQWGNQYGQSNVGSWKNIVAVAAGIWHSVGLKADGTVVAVGDNEDGRCNVGKWTDIVAVAASGHTVGLKSDGTVVATGSNKAGQCNVSGWKDIVAISVGSNFTVGLKADGTVVATGTNGDGECNVSGWRNIVAIGAGMSHTVGLKADGSVVAVGWNAYDQLNVGSWNNIIAIYVGMSHNIGVKADGTLVTVGNNLLGQCNIDGFTNIRLPERLA